MVSKLKISIHHLLSLILIFALLSPASCVRTRGISTPVNDDPLSSSPTRTSISLSPRPSVSLDLVLITPPRPLVALLLMPGGPGLAGISGINISNRRDFVTITAEQFVAQGIAVAVIDAASDQPNGLTPDYRQTAAHLAELNIVITRIKQNTGLPVWVLGISRSTLSAMHAGINTEVSVNGLVLLSSITNIPVETGVTNLTDVGLDKVRVPALIIAHEKDSCQGTPPSGAQQIVNRLKNSPNAVVKLFRGGFTEAKNPCLPASHHTFNGIQDQVAAFIIEFIKTNAELDNHDN